MMHTSSVIASEARQSSTLRQPLDCRVAALLAMTKSLRAFAPSRETNTQLSCALTLEITSRRDAETRRESGFCSASSAASAFSARTNLFSRRERRVRRETQRLSQSNLRASASPREPQLSFCLSRKREDAKGSRCDRNILEALV